MRDLRKSDGRLHRAARAVRRLVALNLTKDEVVDLFEQVKARRRPENEEDVEVPVPHDREERLTEAQSLIRRLISLGFAECEIAALSGLAAATITRTLDPHAGHSIGSGTFTKIYHAVEQAAAERLNALLPRLRIHVLETCCDKGLPVNPASSDALESGVRRALHAALLGVETHAPLAPGVTGVLVEIGGPADGVLVVIAPRGQSARHETRLQQLRALEHETGHLHASFRSEREELENALGLDRDRVSPTDGRIA